MLRFERIWVGSDLQTNAIFRSVARAFVPRSLRPPVRKLWWTLANRRATYVDGLALPSRELRASMCGPPYENDEFFVNSVATHARKLVRAVELTSQTRIVDVGCGLGRLPMGLIREGHQVQYLGLDSQDRYVWWCTRYIQRQHPNFQFRHINVENERYNPNGEKIAQNFRLPVSDGYADVVQLWGVLTNMSPEHMRVYLSEVSRILRKGGSVFLTAFAEKGVPAWSFNPPDYVSYPCVGPLHVVRYEDSYLRSIFSTNALTVKAFAYQTVDEKQSEFHLEKQ